ncbi:NYN domain-containing protein [Kribbella sp. NPDC023855]|uniref:NYN domain-containing protein n=1 Tax=Kribbella sp. NPDC023855 TaxID=3154698 RepID=UPI0033F37D7F
MGTVAAYIDGFNLYYSMKNKYGRKYLWLDLVKLTGHLRPEDQVVQVRYFTTIVRGEPEAAANQIHYVDALRAHSGDVLDIQIGWFKRRTLSPCKLCGKHWQCECPRRPRSFEEKETDVALAVSMVEDAAVGIADLTLLVSADSDFAPAVAAVKRIRPTHPVILALPSGSLQPHKRFVDVGFFTINETALRQSQLPEQVYDPVGRKLRRRPEKWG